MKGCPPRRMNETLRQTLRKKVGVTLPLLAISGLLGLSLSIPREARANSGKTFLETMGISIAVGTVLGASTLPFYDQPGKHLINLAYGASAGAVAGVGILVYQWIAGPVHDEFSEDGTSGPGRRNAIGLTHQYVLGRSTQPLDGTGPAIARNDYQPPRSAPLYPTQFWTPVVSLNW